MLEDCADKLSTSGGHTKCKLVKGHKGLHSNQDQTWAGNIEVEQPPPSQWEIIQEGERNGALRLVDGTPHRLPGVTYKPEWSFYWSESREAVMLRADVVVSEHGRLVRKHMRHHLFKVWLDNARFEILINFIQHFIIEFELDLMKDRAYIDGKPLWELTK
jgi:hypothetical protein